MNFFRSCLFSAGYAVLTISYGTLSVFTWLLPALTRHKVICSWTKVTIWWLKISCGIKYTINGLEHLHNIDKPFVALSKHQSTWETIFLQGLFWPSSTVLKKELLRIPFFGWGLRAMKPIPIDRSHPKEALKQVKIKGCSRLAEGQNLILFPEGTRTKPGERTKYARSGADIAKSSGSLILPVAHNAGLYWPSKQFTKRPGTIEVVIGEAISTDNKTTKEIIGQVEQWIEQTSATLC